jgi:hypothetical protein
MGGDIVTIAKRPLLVETVELIACFYITVAAWQAVTAGAGPSYSRLSDPQRLPRNRQQDVSSACGGCVRVVAMAEVALLESAVRADTSSAAPLWPD